MKQSDNPLKLQGVGLGTFPFSNVFGRVSAEEAGKITHYFLEHGGTYIQTSPYYVDVEQLLGKILSGVPRTQYKIATLCVKDKGSRLSGKHAAVIAQCEQSLSRLRLDYIDLLMTSTPEATDAPFSETVVAMQELKSQGKIRAIGVCNVTLKQLKEYNAHGAVEYVQNRLSLIDQEADRDVRNYCAEQKIALIPYNVIEWGLLTDKSLTEWTLRDDDLRTKVLPVFGDAQKTFIRQWVSTDLKPIADEYHTTIEALAIAWALQQPGVVTCPVGATSVSQISSSLRTSKLASNYELSIALQAAYEDLSYKVQNEYGMPLNDYLLNSYGRW